MTKGWLIAAALLFAGGGTAAVALSGDDAPADEQGAEAGSKAAKGKRNAKKGGAARRFDDDEDRSDQPMEERVAELEQEVRELRAMLGVRKFAAAARGADGWDEGTGAGGEGDPTFREAVRSVMEDEREERREERMERRQQRFEERTQEWIAALSAIGGGLSPRAQETLQGLWTAEREQMMSLVEQGRSGEVSWRELRPQMQKLREQTEAQLTDVLDGDQMARYRELREDERGWGRGRGPGGGRRGG